MSGSRQSDSDTHWSASGSSGRDVQNSRPQRNYENTLQVRDEKENIHPDWHSIFFPSRTTPNQPNTRQGNNDGRNPNGMAPGGSNQRNT